MKVHTEPTRYEVSCFPLGHPERRNFTITVEWRSKNCWAVKRDSYCLGADGTWGYELQPSSRTDEWREAHRFRLGEALRLAAEQAPLITVNGFTVEGVIAWRADHGVKDEDES